MITSNWYVETLRTKLAAADQRVKELEEALRFIRDECDMDAGFGDHDLIYAATIEALEG